MRITHQRCAGSGNLKPCVSRLTPGLFLRNLKMRRIHAMAQGLAKHQHGKQPSAQTSFGRQTPLSPSGSPSSAQRGRACPGLDPGVGRGPGADADACFAIRPSNSCYRRKVFFGHSPLDMGFIARIRGCRGMRPAGPVPAPPPTLPLSAIAQRLSRLRGGGGRPCPENPCIFSHANGRSTGTRPTVDSAPVGPI